MRLRPHAFVLAVAALSACGAGPSHRAPGSSSADPRAAPAIATVEAYFHAVRAGDGSAICSRFAAGLRRHIERVQSQPCPKALGAEARRLPENLAGYRVRSAQVTGRSARVVVDGQGGFRDEVGLARDRGRWLITSAPGLGR